MQWNVLYLVVLLLIVCACEKPEEVLPIPPPGSGGSPPALAAPEEFEEVDKPVLDTGSEAYHYGSFENLPFRYLVPRSYDSTISYPLHIFLHGIGERGNDNEKHLENLGGYFLADSVRANYPAFIVVPQCPTDSYWFSNDVMGELEGLIRTFIARFMVDEKRISIGGFSMGAYGTFAMVARYPALFEGAIAISGDGEEETASAIASARWHLFAGGKDDVVPSSKTEKMARALQRAGASVLYKFYPAADHGGTLLNAFSEPDLFEWLFAVEGGGKPGGMHQGQ